MIGQKYNYAFYIYNTRQGCQLSDFGLRSQTFSYPADFLLLFLYMLKKPRPFAHPITKPPASTLEFKNFDSILQKISVTLNKNGKRPHQAGFCAWACGNTYVKHFAQFPDFFLNTMLATLICCMLTCLPARWKSTHESQVT